MKQLSSDLIKPVSAQSSADALSVPTFSSDIDFAQLLQTTSGGGDGGAGTAEIQLSTNASGVEVGETFTVSINVNLTSATASAFTAKIEFPAQILQVVDSDDQLSGAQITFDSTSYTETENTVNNSTGSVLIRAEAATGVSASEGIATITFQVIGEGTGTIEVIEAESSVVNAASENLLSRVGQVQFTVGGNTSEGTGELTENVIPGGEIEDLPKSDLPFAGVISLILGVIFLILGWKLREKYGMKVIKGKGN